MPTDALSSHGTLVAMEQDPVASQGVFTTIAELGDITPPGLMRNEFDVTPQNRDIDSWVMGVLRREPISFPVFFNQTLGTHDHLTGVYKAVIDNVERGIRLTFPDGFTWIGSGFLRSVVPTNPVDGVQTANVNIRLSGPMMINGVEIGG